ncbi:cytochrome ubiquinol oxidase subunit I [Anaerobiospirillum sp. NML120448]|uniref:cytochrome ubiquinol oxidase subunit I n=1 Tax=Anaerobiospirillum sp. NML120448 TaxID=2932816 RepID=UPI001FF615A6|nr:cytochrome ubiquinol oxidase subunit I [Anaerobiospirillum sp. NML120448]MCK0513348.1 cytochrome ubiquinol oxidase subunit I [Anaerobiospirillum sp. NML120448]
MVNELMVELSRWQFAATSLYHFLFVPLTLGISWLVFIMELVYVATGRVIYRDMAKFWGKLFGINFAIGVATGITLEFEFGTNWSNYSHYVGDIFGAPLALEGLMAFFLESTFIGLMFTGWNRFSKKTHLLITFLTALGSNLSAMWILIANGWMQYPEFSQFSPERMRMEMTDFWGLIFSEVAQAKFLHTVTAGYTTAGIFVVGVSAYLMLQRKSFQFAKRSMTIGLLFALCAMGGSGLSGDISALLVTKHQPAKLAAMEAEFHTQEPPAAWSLFAIPNEDEMDNYVSIKIPALLGLIATHSIDTPVKGLRDIVAENEQRVRSGLIANRTLTAMRKGDVTDENMELFKAHQKDLGYGLLLVEHAADPLNPTEQEIKTAARNSVPSVTLNYFAFRVMLGIVSVLGLLCVAAGYFLIYKNDLQARPKVLKVLVLSIPLPFICCEAGWILAEFGRQPWAIQDVLPTYLATSSLSPVDVGISLLCFIGIYTVLLIIEMKLMVKAIKKGPEITEPEEDGKGYPPLPPQGPQGCDAKETQETQEAVAVADASVQAASEAAPAQESEAAPAAEAQAVSAQADDKEKTEAQGKDDSAKGGALNAV